MKANARKSGMSECGFGRTLLAALLILSGIVCVVYGLVIHGLILAEEKESYVDPFTTIVNPFFPEDNTQCKPKEFVFQTVPEWQVIRELTRGGVVRDDSGRIRKTYTGKPPETCPT